MTVEQENGKDMERLETEGDECYTVRQGHPIQLQIYEPAVFGFSSDRWTVLVEFSKFSMLEFAGL